MKPDREIKKIEDAFGAPVAGGGLLHRRVFLHGGLLAAGAGIAATTVARAADSVGASAPPSL